MKQHAVFLKVTPVLLVLVTATFSVVSLLSVDLRWGHMLAQTRLIGSDFNDESRDSLALQAVAFRVVALNFFGDDTPDISLRFSQNYADFEDSYYAPFICRSEGGEDEECAGMKLFVAAVHTVARTVFVLMVIAIMLNILSFFLLIGSHLVRENKFTIHASWVLVFLAELFYLSAVFVWGVRVLNETIETNGAKITGGVGYGLACVGAILNFAALVLQLLYLKVKAELELSPSESRVHTPAPFTKDGFSSNNHDGAIASTERREDSYHDDNPFMGETSAQAHAVGGDSNGVDDDNPFDRRSSASASVGLPPPPPTEAVNVVQTNFESENPFDGSGGAGGATGVGSSAYGDAGDDPGW